MESYKELNLKRIEALYKRASSLFYGKDVHMGGDDWCQTKDYENELQAHKIIALLYNEISPYEEEILSEVKAYEEQHPYALHRCGEQYDTLFLLSDIIKSYEDETQYVLELEKISDEDETNVPSKKLLDFIIFKKRDEFSLLFQTIINNHIDDGLDRAAITYILYSSSMFNSKKYHEWNPFYRQFCQDIGWVTTAYKPNRLTSTINSLKSRFFWVDAIK